VRWRPYQLDPSIPEGGLDRAEYMETKLGRDGRLKAIHDHLIRLGAEVGISFAFDRTKRALNTLEAHRLVRWAASAGAQREVVDRLVRVYFVEGRDVGDRDMLLDAAAASGLDANNVGKLFEEGADTDAVRREIAEAQAIGVTGVPFFIFVGRIGVPGARDISLMRQAMAQAQAGVSEAPAA
jgi:predicted DsbA family dithiol-disulfide isomerase